VVGQGPLHHEKLPVEGSALSRAIGRGSAARAKAGMSLLKAAEKTPEPLLKAVGTVVSPPEK